MSKKLYRVVFILFSILFFLCVGFIILQFIANIFFEGSQNIIETVIIMLLSLIIILLYVILQKLDAKDIGKE